MKNDIRIIKHVGTITSGEGNYQKELNIVSIDGAAFCYDLREWSLDHSTSRNGLSLKNEEATQLLTLLRECFKNNDEGIIDLGISVKSDGVKRPEQNADGSDQVKSQENTDEKLYSFLKAKGIKYTDKRSKGGALWIVGGHELDDIMNECANLGFKFYYSEKGGRITKSKPGWYLLRKRV